VGYWFSIAALDVGETFEVADGQGTLVAEDGGSSVAGYGVVAAAGTWDRGEVPDGDSLDVDTVSGIVGDRNAAAKMEIGALFYEDAGSVITADGSEAVELHRRVFGAEDTAAGNWSLRWTSTAVCLDQSSTIDLQMGPSWMTIPLTLCPWTVVSVLGGLKPETTVLRSSAQIPKSPLF